jgi:Tol biopolymer transport system component
MHKGAPASKWHVVPGERELVTPMFRNPTRRNLQRFGLPMAVLLVLSVLAIVAEAPASATTPGANGRIAYTRDRVIWTMDADGGNQAPLATAFSSDHYEPTWSPDGKRVALRLDPSTAGSRDDIWQRIIGVGIGNLTNTIGVDEFEPAWSPDGSKIAYRRSGAIWTMNADGSGQAPLTSPAMTISHAEPAWSPDGTKIAFERHWAIEGADIWVVNADGTGTPLPLTETPAIDEFEPTWSPDGARIAYRRTGLIWTMNADGSDQAQLTSYVDGLDVEPSWSPDGTKIAYRHIPDVGADDIYVMNADGSDRINLTNSPGIDESEPAWQPLNRKPVAVGESYTTPENTDLVISAPGVLGNDSDPDGHALTVVNPLALTASRGTVSMAEDGSFTYTPNHGFTGTDAFTYRATDGTDMSNNAWVTIEVHAEPQVGLVNPQTGEWHLDDGTGAVTTFYYGNPGDYPFMGDWDGDGIDTPGLYRQSDGYVYLRNSNSEGIADITFFFGNPGDVPLAGDFNGCGFDTVSIYRPSEARFYIITELGEDGGGLGAADYSFLFGDAGDKPVVGDWDGDGVDEIGLHRESSGFFYYRNTLTTGIADGQFYFGDPGDRFVAGDWGVPDGDDSPGLFRPSNLVFYFRHTLTQGNADHEFTWLGAGTSWLPVAGHFDL